MIKKIFETNRPIFFISDPKEFDFLPFDENGMRNLPFSSTGTTLSILCLPAFNEGDNNLNEVFIYVHEYPTANDVANFSPIFNGKLSIPSRAIEISESDMFIIFEQSFDTDVVYLTVFIEKDYDGDAPSKFIVILNDAAAN